MRGPYPPGASVRGVTFTPLPAPSGMGPLGGWCPTWLARMLSGMWYRAHVTALRRDCDAAGHVLHRDWQMTTPTWTCACGKVVTSREPT